MVLWFCQLGLVLSSPMKRVRVLSLFWHTTDLWLLAVSDAAVVSAGFPLDDDVKAVVENLT